MSSRDPLYEALGLLRQARMALLDAPQAEVPSLIHEIDAMRRQIRTMIDEEVPAAFIHA